MGSGSTTLICFGVCFGFFMLTGVIASVLVVLGRREESKALAARAAAEKTHDGDRPS